MSSLITSGSMAATPDLWGWAKAELPPLTNCV